MEGEKYFVRVAAENQVGRGYHLETDQPITAKLPFGMNYFTVSFANIN